MSGSNSAKASGPKTDPEKLKFLGLVSHELKTPLNASAKQAAKRVTCRSSCRSRLETQQSARPVIQPGIFFPVFCLIGNA